MKSKKNKQLNGMYKIVHDLKEEKETLKKTQI